MKVRRLGKQYRKRKLPRRVVWNYRPTQRQAEAHGNPARYRLYGGAMGGGKTVWLCAEAIRLSLQWPGNRGYFCRNTITDFRRSTLVTFSRLCPPEFIRGHYRDDRVIELVNGSEIVYGGLGGEEDLERIKSTEFGWFGIDEATETTEEHFFMLCSRLRWRLPDGRTPRYAGILASNPEPGWVKERFVDRSLPDHAFIRALPKDNPHLAQDYEEKLREVYPHEWVRRYVEGSWDVFEGQIYKEFVRERHVYRDVEISPWWQHFRSIDHGYTNPTCCLWGAVDHDGRLWIYDEHYERELVIRENARIIRQKHPDFRGVTLIDPSCFAATQHQGEGKVCSVADEYRKFGIVCISPYSRDGWVEEALGINIVKRYLQEDLLRIHESCVNTVTEMLKYRWRDLRTSSADRNALEIPVDRDNHAMDALRYLAVWKPPGSPPPKDPRRGETVHEAILKHKRMLGLRRFIGWD
jgi:PBSX family phage terminase large subunit